MGKSNRIRNDRANTTLTSVKPRNKKGMPSWALNLITIVVTVLILASVAISLLGSNGVFMRMQTAVKSDHFRVDANMMNYYFKTQYNSFVSENSSYLQYYGLDTGKSLKEQYVNGSDEADGTWFDYMMQQTTAQVEEILVYCEEAYARDIELDDEDKAKIDEELEMYKTYASMYGYTTNVYVSNMYGKGMKLSDVRNALELSTLASKCSAAIGEELEGTIAASDVDAEYAANKLDYDLVDYSSYTITVKYDDVVKEVLGKDNYTDDEAKAKEAEIIEAYKAKIATAKSNASLLAASADRGTFEAFASQFIVEDLFNTNYDDAIKDSEVPEADMPVEEDENAIRSALISFITGKIKSGEHLDENSVVVDGKVVNTEITVKDTYAEVIKEMAHDIADSAKDKLEATYTVGAKYSDTDDALVWAFEEGRKENERKTFEEGDGADGAELAASADELDTFTVKAYLLVKPQYRSELLTRNLGLMVFATAEEAEAALAKLYEGITVEDFEAISNELGGQFTNYENYTKGSMGVEAFDAWLYGEDVKAGSFTAEVITLSESSFAVAVYYADGDAEWYVSVKSALFTEKYEALDAEVKAKYTVEKKDSVIAKIDG